MVKACVIVITLVKERKTVSTSQKTSPRVYLVNDTSLNLNWGSRATTYKLRQMLNRVGAEVVQSLPLHHLNRLDWDARPATARVSGGLRKVTTRHPFSKLGSIFLNNTAQFLPEVMPKRWSEFEAFAKQVMAGRILPQVKEALSSCDVVVINGEGGIFGNQRESRAMLFIAYLAKTFFDKPVTLVSHSADLRQGVLQDIAQHVYPRLDDAVFREAKSREQCASFVAGKVAADVTFDYKPAPREAWLEVASQPGYFHLYPELWGEFDPKKPYVCVGGSSIYFRKDQPKYNPVPSFTKLCQRLQHEVGQVVLTASAAADLPIFEPIAKSLQLPLVRPELPPQQAVDLLGHASAYIGGRWHSSIFAATGGTPILTLAAHTFKVDALNEQLELQQAPFNPFTLEQDLDTLLQQLNTCLAHPELRIELRNRARKLGRLSWENVRFVRDMVKERSRQAA
jgi:polysaccharide pyruvyl transferase WcaK-like protein